MTDSLRDGPGSRQTGRETPPARPTPQDWRKDQERFVIWLAKAWLVATVIIVALALYSFGR